ncbi:MAG: hypothetical protein EOO27_24275 [Comamonadaceae bacterium]|nr:MAG: hypothetical protein EOO27_24275 [Comamonadaceae bacterium]
MLADLTDAIGATLAEGPVADRIEPESIENELIRLCVVAGQLDQLYRAYPFVIDKTPLLDGERVVTIEQACAQVPWFVIDEIHDQIRIANDGLGPLRAGMRTASCGMSFTGSGLIGGADADLLVDGLLLDFKSTHAATTITRADVYQLAGYTLLDFDDAHHIEQVGIYWTRHGVTRTFTLPTFFKLLGATAPIAELRTELRTELTAYQNGRRRALLARADHEHIPAPEQMQLVEESRLRRTTRWLRGAIRR